MDIIVNDTHRNLNKEIEGILIKSLIGGFELVCSSKCLWDNEFDTMIDNEEFNEYMYENVIHNVFNGKQLNDMTIFECKYNLHKNKHSGLINLYTKLDIKTKQKKTISKILNNKFDMDILQNILDCY
jgi:hypothetical protein